MFGSLLHPYYLFVSTNFSRFDEPVYPDDFGEVLNEVKIYRCEISQKRVIISNGIPDHSFFMHRDMNACEVPYAIELPLHPKNPDPDRPIEANKEIPIRGMVAIAKNGVPAFGAQEVDGANAVEPCNITGCVQDAQYWYGHPNTKGGWHVHDSHMGVENITEATFLGWAMDGFRIYGALEDDSILDDCNGIEVDGTYRYHVRTRDQVNGTQEYCNGDSVVINWNYLLGCYAGSISRGRVLNANSYVLPDDCIRESEGECTDDPDWRQEGDETRDCDWVGSDVDEDTLITRCAAFDKEAFHACPGTCKNTECVRAPDPPYTGPSPNIIIMQPDDLPFLDEWGPPPNNPNETDSANTIPVSKKGKSLMPHIEKLRKNGLQMMQAYTASPVCGTSRFSTITGRYPGRSTTVQSFKESQPTMVTIPTTKLMSTDCASDNIAAAFHWANRHYRTGMFGKWHLTKFDMKNFNYAEAVETIKDCGFDHVGGMFPASL